MITRRSMPVDFNRGLVAQTGALPQGSRFLQDTYAFQVKEVKQAISESIQVAGNKVPVLRITGIYQKADAPNQNGRVYPRSVIEEAVGALQADIRRRVVMGEFDHPPDAKIHLERVSHLITRVWMEGMYVYGEAEVIEGTDQGRNLAALLRAGINLGISSRGVGDMEVVNEGSDSEFYRVQPGYRFVTWDVVGEPSVSEATLSVMESRQIIRPRQSKIITRAGMHANDPKALLLAEIKRHLSI